MRQDKIIAEIAKMTDEQLLVYDATGLFKTSAVMHAAGIACCSFCGHLQPVEVNVCNKCQEQIFVVITDKKRVKLVAPKPLKKEKGKTITIKKVVSV